MPYNFTLDPHSWDTLHHLLLDPSVVKGTASPFLPSLFIYPYIYLFIFVSENRNLKLFLSTITFYFLFFFFSFLITQENQRFKNSSIIRKTRTFHYISLPPFFILFFILSLFFFLFSISLFSLLTHIYRNTWKSKFKISLIS